MHEMTENELVEIKTIELNTNMTSLFPINAKSYAIFDSLMFYYVIENVVDEVTKKLTVTFRLHQFSFLEVHDDDDNVITEHDEFEVEHPICFVLWAHQNIEDKSKNLPHMF